MSERHAILHCLKRRGELSAADVAAETGLTSMGARGHLERLHASGLVYQQDIAAGRGRPKRLWRLSEAGHEQFPQRYDHLSIELIDSIRQTFGEQGLEQLIVTREQNALVKYSQIVAKQSSAALALEALAKQRSDEGYMAEVIATDGGWELIEHHCPICAAAESCQDFCRSELAIFQQALGEGFNISRTEHLLNDGSRCRYAITPVKQGDDQ